MAAGRKRECFIRALLSFPEGCFVKLESRAERFFYEKNMIFSALFENECLNLFYFQLLLPQSQMPLSR